MQKIPLPEVAPVLQQIRKRRQFRVLAGDEGLASVFQGAHVFLGGVVHSAVHFRVLLEVHLQAQVLGGDAGALEQGLKLVIHGGEMVNAGDCAGRATNRKSLLCHRKFTFTRRFFV